jgi:hypothetical protein
MKFFVAHATKASEWWAAAKEHRQGKTGRVSVWTRCSQAVSPASHTPQFLQIPVATSLPHLNSSPSRFYRILTMVCSTQNYWVFCLFPTSGDFGSRNTTFGKLDMFPSSGEGEEQLSRCIIPPSPEDGNRSSFRNVVFLLPKSPDDGNQKPSNSLWVLLVLLCVISRMRIGEVEVYGNECSVPRFARHLYGKGPSDAQFHPEVTGPKICPGPCISESHLCRPVCAVRHCWAIPDEQYQYGHMFISILHKICHEKFHRFRSETVTLATWRPRETGYTYWDPPPVKSCSNAFLLYFAVRIMASLAWTEVALRVKVWVEWRWTSRWRWLVTFTLRSL